jgi:hypothetical protein
MPAAGDGIDNANYFLRESVLRGTCRSYDSGYEGCAFVREHIEVDALCTVAHAPFFSTASFTGVWCSPLLRRAILFGVLSSQ